MRIDDPLTVICERKKTDEHKCVVHISTHLDLSQRPRLSRVCFGKAVTSSGQKWNFSLRKLMCGLNKCGYLLTMFFGIFWIYIIKVKVIAKTVNF